MHNSPQVVTRTMLTLAAVVGLFLVLSAVVPRNASAATNTEVVDTNLTD